MPVQLSQQVRPKTRAAVAEHDGPWKPSKPPKRGHNKTLAPFPEYIEGKSSLSLRNGVDPSRAVTRKRKIEGEEEKPTWRYVLWFNKPPNSQAYLQV